MAKEKVSVNSGTFLLINKTQKMKKTLGGDRLGAGNKMQVELHGYERSTHDVSYTWRSTMSAGTLVPFLNEIVLPGDTYDIHLGCNVMTHPTIGPAFTSAKVQLDVFQIPIRLYLSALHNNMLKVGMNMSQIKLPKIELTSLPYTPNLEDYDNIQINPSCVLNYLGIRGIGRVEPSFGAGQTRKFHALWILAMYDIYKNYYANKQEEIGYVIHTPSVALIETVGSIKIFTAGTETTLQQTSGSAIPLVLGSQIRIYWDDTTDPQPLPEQIIITTNSHGQQSAQSLTTGVWTQGAVGAGAYIWSPYRQTYWGNDIASSWDYTNDQTINTGEPQLREFPLSNIDSMREAILAAPPTTEFIINDTGLEPYKYLWEQPNDIPNTLSSQEGLLIKTYQSDMLNAWLQTEWIDGPDGITAITAIDTSGGSFTLDTLNLSKKVYELLNRVMVSGGSYNDWQDVVWGHERYTQTESPMYIGGLIKELVFQQVVSNSATDGQPLGTLAGMGRMTDKHKGGTVIAKIDEPSLLLGFVSLTPRIDISQGNKWDVYALDTMDDLHKPALDGIGFQDLPTEQMAWWDTYWDGSKWVQPSAGKQPAWTNYTTNLNRTYGNFAITDNEMFMTFNRRYEPELDPSGLISGIKDLTTYIDPTKFNFIFADTALDAQNYWVQISADITARRKMSAKIMPNI